VPDGGSAAEGEMVVKHSIRDQVEVLDDGAACCVDRTVPASSQALGAVSFV
jgi:hypothetical protein